MADSGHGSTPGGAHSKQGGFQDRLLILGVILLFAFGLAVPAVVLISNGSSKASDGPAGMKLNKEEVAGRELFATTCVYCHALASEKSYGRTGPDLDVVLAGMSDKERQTFVEDAIEEGENHGIGQMPALLFQGKEAKEVAGYVAAVAGAGLKQSATVEPAGYPELANRAEGERAMAEEKAAEPKLTGAKLAEGKEIFEDNCSTCHALAAAKATGNIGPNLDKLRPGFEQIKAQVESGSSGPNGLMPHFGTEKLLTPKQIEMVARYVANVEGT